MPFTEFISSLRERGLNPKREGTGFRSTCPSHNDDDGRPSLTVTQGNDGRILLKCWSGCEPEQIVAAMGLTMRDLFCDSNGKPKTARSKTAYPSIQVAGSAIAKRLQGRFTQHWTYQHADGRETFAVLRFDGCESEQKQYRPIHRNGVGYVEGDPPGKLPLYRLPELLNDPGSRVFVVEGEKACEAARTIGLLASTSAHGANCPGKTDWTPLAGRDVMILPDNDEAGQRYAQRVRDILLALDPPTTVRIANLPGLPDGGDIWDFVEEHDAVESETLGEWVMTLADEVKPEQAVKTEIASPQAELVWMTDVTAMPVEWLWPDRIPAAMLSLLVGVEGTGKTFAALDMAARITTGRLWPDGEIAGNAPIGNVIFLTSEDHLAYTIKPRLEAMGADMGRIAVLKEITTPNGNMPPDITRHQAEIETAIQQAGRVRLIIVDPLTAFLGAVDQHKNGEVRAALSGFNTLAERYGCAILGISHLTKDASKAAIHRTLGSVAFTAAARAVWLVGEDRQNKARRLFVSVKMNLGPKAKSLAFTIQGMAVRWEQGLFDYDADEILAVDGQRGSPMRNRARDWLEIILADGPVKASKVLSMGEKEGFSKRTLDRAKAELGVESEKSGLGINGEWRWGLPKVPMLT